MTQYLQQGTANASFEGPFITSRETASLVHKAREAASLFLNSEPEEVIFGPNMTTLTFSMSRAIVKTLPKGSEILLTAMDHDANITSWQIAAAENGCSTRLVPVNAEGNLTIESFQTHINDNTSLVAFSLASNATGSLSPAQEIIKLAHRFGALVYLDAVHYAAHKLIDIKALGCDFLACSPYKFFGPHLGMVYGKKEHLTSIPPCKARAASDISPSCWETGTQSFEAIVGFHTCLNYLASLSGEPLSRRAIETAFAAINDHETELSKLFLNGARDIPGLTVYGNQDEHQRTSTFGITLKTMNSAQTAERLGERGIFCWSGHFYAVELIRSLGLEERGGMLRIGFMHYNTEDEVFRVLQALKALAGS